MCAGVLQDGTQKFVHQRGENQAGGTFDLPDLIGTKSCSTDKSRAPPVEVETHTDTS